jgi:hypothetical protein
LGARLISRRHTRCRAREGRREGGHCGPKDKGRGAGWIARLMGRKELTARGIRVSRAAAYACIRVSRTGHSSVPLVLNAGGFYHASIGREQGRTLSVASQAAISWPATSEWQPIEAAIKSGVLPSCDVRPARRSSASRSAVSARLQAGGRWARAGAQRACRHASV